MGFSAMDSLIGFAVGAKRAFNYFDKLESDALLLLAGISAYLAVFTNPGHADVFFCY